VLTKGGSLKRSIIFRGMKPRNDSTDDAGKTLSGSAFQIVAVSRFIAIFYSVIFRLASDTLGWEASMKELQLFVIRQYVVTLHLTSLERSPFLCSDTSLLRCVYERGLGGGTTIFTIKIHFHMSLAVCFFNSSSFSLLNREHLITKCHNFFGE